MTAAAYHDRAPHPLVRGASPAVVRQWLLPRDAERFVSEYEAALDDARCSLELGGVHDVVERWRRIAVLQTVPDGYRRTVRRAPILATGEASPEEDEPLDVTCTKAGG
jgi:Family of unknown function (DUF6247)